MFLKNVFYFIFYIFRISKQKANSKMEDQFRRYEKDLVELIKSAKTKLADQIPIAERGNLPLNRKIRIYQS